MNCTQCRHSNPDGAKFCNNCAAEMILKCLECGTELNADDSFCYACGKRVEQALETQPEAPAVAIEQPTIESDEEPKDSPDYYPMYLSDDEPSEVESEPEPKPEPEVTNKSEDEPVEIEVEPEEITESEDKKEPESSSGLKYLRAHTKALETTESVDEKEPEIEPEEELRNQPKIGAHAAHAKAIEEERRKQSPEELRKQHIKHLGAHAAHVKAIKELRKQPKDTTELIAKKEPVPSTGLKYIGTGNRSAQPPPPRAGSSGGNSKNLLWAILGILLIVVIIIFITVSSETDEEKDYDAATLRFMNQKTAIARPNILPTPWFTPPPRSKLGSYKNQMPNDLSGDAEKLKSFEKIHGATTQKIYPANTLQDFSESATHFINAINYQNNFTSWTNNLAGRNPQPSFDEWVEQVNILYAALNSSKQVPSEWLDLIHPELRSTWQGYLIPALEQQFYYYYTALYYPEKIEEMNASGVLVSSLQFGEAWGNWYGANRDAIRFEINKKR